MHHSCCCCCCWFVLLHFLSNASCSDAVSPNRLMHCAVDLSIDKSVHRVSRTESKAGAKSNFKQTVRSPLLLQMLGRVETGTHGFNYCF
uniref:Putative secreted protein n=1 Tax=Anopheles triannulatus TaxID=58253 RepID=A0A2M4B422_9DIPT